MLVASLATTFHAQEPPQRPGGSVAGAVLDADNGLPVGSAIVVIHGVPGKPQGRIEVSTDSQGHYRFKDVPPGRYRLEAQAAPEETSGQKMTQFVRKPISARSVIVADSEAVSGVNLKVHTRLATISGKVVDTSNNPVPGVMVRLVEREYYLGSLRYYLATPGSTDDHGEYSLIVPDPGQSFLVVAIPPRQNARPISIAPEDWTKRAPILAPTYFPSARMPESGELVSLRPGEQREGVNIKLIESPSFCISGIMRLDGHPSALYYQFAEAEPSNGPRNFTTPPPRTIGPDGRFRFCELHPGVYRLVASEGPFRAIDEKPSPYGMEMINVLDRDVTDINVGVSARPGVVAEVLWENGPTKDTINTEVTVSMRAIRALQRAQQKCAVPCELTFSNLLPDEYSVALNGLPQGAYVKSLTYAGLDLFNLPLRPGTALDGRVHVLLSQDGGRVSVTVNDADNKSIEDAFVYLIPAGVKSEVELAAELISGQTSADGFYQSRSLRPGKYMIMATMQRVDASPESIGMLWNARGLAEEVDLEPGRVVQLRVGVKSLH